MIDPADAFQDDDDGGGGENDLTTLTEIMLGLTLRQVQVNTGILALLSTMADGNILTRANLERSGEEVGKLIDDSRQLLKLLKSRNARS